MKDKLNVHVVTKDSRPVASVLTMKFRQTLVCKYICSDKAYSNLGPLQFLFWKMIQRAKQEGLAELDLGRTDINNPGLIKFKDRLGADRTPLRYWRYSEAPIVQGQDTWKIELAKQVFSRIPNAWSLAAGALLYKHVG